MKVKILLPLLSCCLLLLTAVSSFAQTGTIRGKVSLSTNETADNVSVTLRGTQIGTSTDAQGNYEIKNIKPGTYTLKVSAVGFSSKEKSIAIKSADELVENFTLATTSEALTEVFVKGNTNKYTKTESEYVSRMAVKNLENSQVYNVVTKELMKDQLVTNQDEALKNVPGLYQLWGATNRAGDGGSWFSLRGFTTQSLIRNGVAGRVNSNSDAANLERIEVIKGPSATLFGNVLASYGGLINRVTKKPYENFGGEIAYQSGSYGFSRLTADINTPVNDDKTALFRLNASYNSAGTFQDYGSSKSYFFAPSFSYKVNEKLTVSIDAEISNQDNSGMPLIYLGALPSQLGFNSAANLNMDFKKSFLGDEFITNTKTFNVFAQANYKISDEWTSQSVFSSNSNKAAGPQTWFYLLPNQELSRNAWNANGQDEAVEFQQNFNGDFYIFGKMRNRFLVGGDIYHSESKSRFGYLNSTNLDGSYDHINYNGPAANYYDFNPSNVNDAFVGQAGAYITQTALSTYSAYVADALSITDRLILSAAVRFDHYQNEGTSDPVSNTAGGDFSQNAFSPKFGLVYQILKDQVSVFGNYQNSFTNIGFLRAENGNLEQFDPERANQVEAGIKVNAFQNKISGTISVYNIKVRDIVVASQTVANTSVQDGTQFSKGFEVEVTANPIAGLNLLVGYSKNDSDLNGLRPATAGPETLINYWFSYNLQTTKLKGLGIGFGGNSASTSVIQNQIVDGVHETFSLPSYTVANAALYYDQPKYRFSLKVNNISNEVYFNGYTTINVQAPRTFMGSVTYKF